MMGSRSPSASARGAKLQAALKHMVEESDRL